MSPGECPILGRGMEGMLGKGNRLLTYLEREPRKTRKKTKEVRGLKLQ